MNKYLEILKKYWGYNEFRDLQLEIIESVVSGNDTLGLLPTGGGKSIIFQVASLSMPGVTIVVTPLIALMKDQVENLRKRGIKATAVYSGMTKREVNIQLDNILYGNFKFLYLSPERLSTPSFIQRLPQMNVNLITIDEAHCISQWGYDFRPNYLKISELRFMLPETPLLALTATATPKVIDDIQLRLEFDKPNVLKKSFVRKNLTYLVRNIENKESYIVDRVRKVKGSGIIYARTRKRCSEISYLLKRNGVSADYYHAGLDFWERNMKQESWMNNETRVIVATNAFGMGIDKPDVRFVIHVNAPDSLESYYQEAGRAGRDGKRAYGILLYNSTDTKSLEKIAGEMFPAKSLVTKVYENIGNYLQLAIGTGEGSMFKFDTFDFGNKFKHSYNAVTNSVKILQAEGYLEYINPKETPTSIMFIAEREYLYDYVTHSKKYDEFIKTLLRSYSGLFSDFVSISEPLLSQRTGLSIPTIHSYLLKLSRDRLISYRKKDKASFILFKRARLLPEHINIRRGNYEDKQHNYRDQIDSVIEYGSSKTVCKSVLLVKHFGERDAAPCGVCNYCTTALSNGLTNAKFDLLKQTILDALGDDIVALHSVKLQTILFSEEAQETLKILIEEEVIGSDERGRIYNRVLE